LTNSFSKLPEGMRAGFQLLIQPTNGEWRHKTTAAAKSIAEGKSAKQHWALAALGAVVNAFRGSADEKEKVEAAARLTPIQEETMKQIREKGSKVGFRTQIRVIAASPRSDVESRVALDTVATAFSQYTSPEL